MRVVLLSSTLGYGHIKAAEAVEEALMERDPTVQIEYVDFWSLFDPDVAGAVKEGYLDVVTHEPKLYDRLYAFDSDAWREFFRQPELPPELRGVFERALTNWFPGRVGFPARGSNLDQTLFLNLISTLTNRIGAHGNLIRRGLVLWMHTLLTRRLKQRLQQFAPDVVISTQMMPSTLLAALKRRGELGGLPAVAVLTDYGVHDFWLRSNMDHYCVATDAMAGELRARGVKDATIAVTGIPLLGGFREPMPQVDARKRLGVALDRPSVLITGGGCGIGARDALEPLLEAELDCQVLIAAGGQQVVDGRLRELATRCSERVHLFADQVDMPALVRAADVVVGKPGGLSVSESLACGRPFLAVCSLGGQESFNVDHLVRNRVGQAVDGPALVEQLQAWLSDPAELARVQARAWSLGCRQGGPAIAAAVLGGRGIGTRDEPERSRT